MFRDSYQRGLLTIFYSKGSKPFNIWDVTTKDGYVRSFLDNDIKSMVVEIRGVNVSTSYMVCPKGNQVLGITMPFLIMIVKNLHKYFSFEVTILDETRTRRRFRVSNFQSSTQVLPLCTVMPLSLSAGWNQIQFNLAEFCRRAYNKQFIEVQKMKVNANIRLRRIYFTERIMSNDELPADYKLFLPLPPKPRKSFKKEIIDEEPRLAEIHKEPSLLKPPSTVAVSKVEQEQVQKGVPLEDVTPDIQAEGIVKHESVHEIKQDKGQQTDGNEMQTIEGEEQKAAEGGENEVERGEKEAEGGEKELEEPKEAGEQIEIKQEAGEIKTEDEQKVEEKGSEEQPVLEKQPSLVEEGGEEQPAGEQPIKVEKDAENAEVIPAEEAATI